MIEITVTTASVASHDTPLLILLVPKGQMPPSMEELDKACGSALTRLYQSEDFSGERDTFAVLYPDKGVDRLLVVGTGSEGEPRQSDVRRAAAVAARQAVRMRCSEAAAWLPDELATELGGAAAAQALVEGLSFGSWEYVELQKPDPQRPSPLGKVEIIATAGLDGFEEGRDLGYAIAQGQSFARTLQALPGNRCTPSDLADYATELAGRHGMEIKVLDREGIVEEAMGALLAIAQGSSQEPRFIAVEYQGGDGPPVVLVGKGVTFDTGGISIKPALNMEEMKYDMSGAAAVLGALEAVGLMKPRLNVVGLIPTAENMPSASAVKPGDVVTASDGTTIEVINTDAEGRLLLADALAYAQRYQPACILDIATLTGAVVVALGHSAIGLLGTDDDLVEETRQAGERSGERAWPLPLWDEYRELMKSQVADIKNSGGRPAGTITAAQFLRHFVADVPWAHLDIAGTAYTDKPQPTMAKGPTGVGVRLFCEFILGRQTGK